MTQQVIVTEPVVLRPVRVPKRIRVVAEATVVPKKG